ncbi:MAG: hypothetical protein EPN98_07870 [Phenylobacterium sp.]|uniref:hypothetical protein n=1 Tax=Phenylobacterium sp. TaxID=1871053 RepID=UPI00121BBDD2|nr:hypothetical protein [Phenylobacterium sp.]TAL34964.1 MAG: hypothetical protein EPN98_07870 [Phenylobacterium sp.]
MVEFQRGAEWGEVVQLNLRYVREMREHFGYSATWLPTIALRLGDVGRLTGGGYEPLGSLADFGIGFETRTGVAYAELSYVSSNAVTFTAKAAGATPAAGSALAHGDAGIQLSFAEKQAVFFQAAQCKTSEIAPLLVLEQQIVAAAEKGDWKKDYVVVTEVVEAQAATIVISSSGNALIELKAKAGASLAPATMVDLSADLSIAQSRDIGTQLVAQGGLAPLFRARSLHNRLMARPTLKARDVSNAASPKIETTRLRLADYGDA